MTPLFTLALIGALDWEPCRLRARDYLPSAKAHCATLSVPLDPASPDGEVLELFVARAPALRASPEPDPLLVIAGGPGQSAADYYASQQAAFEPVLRARDVILVDQRGTGRSARMDCPQQEDAELEGASPEAIEASVKECLEQLPHAPQLFTTSVAVEDLERVREALGLETWNVYGISYGTRVALHYLKRHPEALRSVVLDGVVGRDRVLGPDIALRSQETLEALFARCRANDACRDANGDPAEHLAALLERLRAGPVHTRILDPQTGREMDAEFTLEQFRGVLRLLAYRPESHALIPVLLYEAAQHENYAPLATQSETLVRELGRDLAFGMHNAVVCTEDAPAFAPNARLEAQLEATYLGAGQLDYLVSACAHWPAGRIDDDFRAPIETERPLLILSGELDPITPPTDAEPLAKRASQAVHLVAPGQGHGVLGAGCVPQVVGRFLDSLAAGPLDDACVQRLGPLPFAVDLNGPPP